MCREEKLFEAQIIVAVIILGLHEHGREHTSSVEGDELLKYLKVYRRLKKSSDFHIVFSNHFLGKFIRCFRK